MPDRTRRWAALAVALWVLSVLALGTWLASRVIDDRVGLWGCYAILATWLAVFFACIAFRPQAARKLGLIGTIPLSLAPIVLAFITSR
jgi:hypothetical protein